MRSNLWSLLPIKCHITILQLSLVLERVDRGTCWGWMRNGFILSSTSLTLHRRRWSSFNIHHCKHKNNLYKYHYLEKWKSITYRFLSLTDIIYFLLFIETDWWTKHWFYNIWFQSIYQQILCNQCLKKTYLV